MLKKYYDAKTPLALAINFLPPPPPRFCFHMYASLSLKRKQRVCVVCEQGNIPYAPVSACTLIN